MGKIRRASQQVSSTYSRRQSRRQKLQRFLELPSLTIETIWLPIFKDWLNQRFAKEEVLCIAMDRTVTGID
jgi:hypothetical protein